MTDGFSFKLDNKAVLARLSEISKHYADLSPVMLAIGEHLSESTKERFSDSIAPDGTRWKPNAPATLLAQLAKISGNYVPYTNLKTGKAGRVRESTKKGFFDKAGRITKKSAGLLANKKPLIDSGLLQDSIRYQLINGGNGVEVGTDRFSGEWDGGAAVFHYGSRDGKIPARPFLGMSAADETEVLDIIENFLQIPV